MAARGWEKREWGVTSNGPGVSFWGDKNENVPEIVVTVDHLVNVLKTTGLYTLKG